MLHILFNYYLVFVNGNLVICLIFNFWWITISSLNLSDYRRELIPLQNSTKKIDFFPPYFLQNKKRAWSLMTQVITSWSLSHCLAHFVKLSSSWGPECHSAGYQSLLSRSFLTCLQKFYDIFPLYFSSDKHFSYMYISEFPIDLWRIGENSRTFKDKFNFFQKHLRTVSTELGSRNTLKVTSEETLRSW